MNNEEINKIKIAKHKEICEQMHELYKIKNKDYGSSVTDTYRKYGIVSFLVRLSDKLNRLDSITRNGHISVKDEKLEDTLLDLANYAVIALVEIYSGNIDKINLDNKIILLSDDPISKITFIGGNASETEPDDSIEGGLDEY